MISTINSILDRYTEDDVIIYHHNRGISLRDILNDLEFLDKLLPAHDHILNLYENRYYFLLGLLLGIKRNSIHLFPSNITPHTINYLKKNYSNILVLNDTDLNIANCSHIDIKQLLKQKQISTLAPEYISIKNFFNQKPIENERVIIFTSGSTGEPQPFTKNWNDFIEVATQMGKQLNLNKKSMVLALATVPAQHMYGLEISIMTALLNGLTLHSERPFYPADISKILCKSKKPVLLITTPIHLRACMRTQINLPFLTRCISSTAPLDRDLACIFEKTHNTSLIEIYGCTEIGVIATRQTAETERWQCLSDIELNHHQGDNIQLSSKRSIQHFLLNDHISDLKNNSFVLQGRKIDLINIAGKRTSLSYLNHHLLTADHIEDGCFYQIDEEEDIQQRLVVFIVSKLDNTDMKKSILNHLKSKIEAIFLPRRFFFVEQLPRNKTGKLVYNDIKILYQKIVSEQHVSKQ